MRRPSAIGTTLGEPRMDDPRSRSAGTPHAAHWGSFSARWDGERLAVTPHPDDPAPSPI
ncbi:hypothetical protein, partial [Enterobacter hormaechei]|uniref:hypothetical protein n=1 Tax=Enterobacter hormaechei TaxID=158836 RepID=UPI0019533D48